MQLAFEPFGEQLEFYPRPHRRRPEISIVTRRTIAHRSAPLCTIADPLERAIARCECAAQECEEMARSSAKARNACWAAYGATKRLK